MIRPVTAQQAEPEVSERPLLEEPAGLPAADEAILRMRQSVLEGQHWFEAVLDAIGRWRVPYERIGDRDYCYLVGGEAFDWLLLAERLVDEMPDLVPSSEANALLFDGRWPLEIDDADFCARLGPAKHSAHLNYLYGVLVEEALQLTIEEEIHKENRNRPWGQDPRSDETVYERVYGLPRIELLGLYYADTGEKIRHEVSLGGWRAFTYWCFKQRLRRQDKARVASDTRKGLAQLTRMELAVSERRRGHTLNETEFAARYSA
jgi:hypothetical protein